MLNLDDFERLKRRVERLKDQKAKAEEVLKRIKAETGCKTVAEAEKFLKKLQDQERQEALAFTKAKASFEKRWRGKLDELD
jgi:ribosomal protein L14E/L6E/L27E